MTTCTYCSKEFSTTFNLVKHQKTAKYCLKLQSEESAKKPPKSFTCKYCGKSLKTSRSMCRHTEGCLERYKTLSTDLEADNAKLRRELETLIAAHDTVKAELAIYKDLSHSSQQTIASIAHQPRTSSSVNINLPPLTREHLEENAQYLSMDHIKKGFKGYAEYALEFPLKGMVTCTDYSRRKVKYNDHNGDVVIDPDMTNLCSNLFSAIRNRNQELTNEYMSEMKEKTASGEWNRNDIQDLMFEAITRNGNVISIANGERPEAITEFVKWVCSGLTSSG